MTLSQRNEAIEDLTDDLTTPLTQLAVMADTLVSSKASYEEALAGGVPDDVAGKAEGYINDLANYRQQRADVNALVSQIAAHATAMLAD